MAPNYCDLLDELVQLCAAIPNTPMTARARISALALMNLRYETIQTDRNLRVHPHILVEGLIRDAMSSIAAWAEVTYAESEDRDFAAVRPAHMEDMHKDLFQSLWTGFNIEEYKSDRIARYDYRLRINGLTPLIQGRVCVDFGCGHGNFAHALINHGAARVVGLDFGEQSIRYAEAVRDKLGVPAERIRFKLATVYDSGEPSDTYDFAIQNGVFHHLEDEDRAYREVHRVLKPGGWFWVYTDGAGAISPTLWDASRMALANVPPGFVLEHLAHLNLSTGKRYHLGDGFNAVYRHTTWEELTGRLTRLGFGDFRRLSGGMPTDSDPDVIAADPYGKEKFGSGDIRLLCRKA